MRKGAAVTQCPLCSFDWFSLNAVEREVHANACAEKQEREFAFTVAKEETTDILIETKCCEPKNLAKRVSTAETSVLAKRFKTGVVRRARVLPLRPLRRQSSPRSSPLSIPFYKTLQLSGQTFAVDAFCYGQIPNVKHYFLTHFHSDHYGGLSKQWKAGPIYCSPSTARLVHQQLGVEDQWLVPIKNGQETIVDGVSVVFLDANHCPGAVVILFNREVLHTGDFRASAGLRAELANWTSHISSVYLDTTYLDPLRTFPAQDAVVDVCAEHCLQLQMKKPRKNFFLKERPTRILVMVGSYSIGKERLALRIAQRLDTNIWASARKHKILDALDLEGLQDRLVNDGTSCQVYLVSMRDVTKARLEEQWKWLQKHYTQLIAFVPTGWTFGKSDSSVYDTESLKSKAITSGDISIYRVPYSEHSSFLELQEFCTALGAHKLIATVPNKHTDILHDWEQK